MNCCDVLSGENTEKESLFWPLFSYKTAFFCIDKKSFSVMEDKHIVCLYIIIPDTFTEKIESFVFLSSVLKRSKFWIRENKNKISLFWWTRGYTYLIRKMTWRLLRGVNTMSPHCGPVPWLPTSRSCRCGMDLPMPLCCRPIRLPFRGKRR